MGQTWLEYKYSFLGDFNSLIESLSEIEKTGLLAKINSFPVTRAYENEVWRINISAERIDFYPKRIIAVDPAPDEFFSAYKLLASMGEMKIARIAINSTVLFGLDTPSVDTPIYKFGEVVITGAYPAEFNHRINVQEKTSGMLVNNITTISKGTFAVNNKPQMGVFIGFDINTAPVKPNEYITEMVSDVITANMVRLFIKAKEKYVKSL
ncbi:MAG: hypothetical protein SPL80_00855 [Bacilli bacterium]|nr:hypothetical protein [Bacilli bacterium]